MPKGYPNTKPVVTIEVPSRTGVRGRIDKLQRDYLMKAEALRIAGDILDADERQQALIDAPKKFLQAMNHRQAHTPVADTTDLRASRKPKAERIADITAFLRQQPMATTSEVSTAIGIHGNRLAMLLHSVAKKKGKNGKEAQWVLRKNIARKSTSDEPMPRQRGKGRFAATPSMNGNGNGHRTRVPAAQTQAEIRAYLAAHPEAYTSEIAKALGRAPKSNLISLIRTVARPAREVEAKQAIPWVLAEA